jgi:hypothetical protein
MLIHNKYINILGYSGTANECPHDTEIWGINIAGKMENRKVDYCFAFDKLPPEYINEMKALAPIISWQSYADFKYPLADIKREFRINYFVNTICYMVAYAIYVKTEKLGLYGCDTFLGATWQRESKGVEFWLGIAHDRGMNLILPPKSGLLRSMQGRIYRGKREVLLTLAERVILLNILDAKTDIGFYDTEIHLKTLKWILMPKADEQKRYKIYFGYDASGKYQTICGEKFRIDIPMSEDVWNYLRKCMADYEQQFGFEDNMLGLYEMLMTSEWRAGEYSK